MNFPESELILFLYAILNTPGLGGIVVALLGGGVLLIVGLTLVWLNQAGKMDEEDVYAYPTSALHHQPEPEPVPERRIRKRQSYS
jgi:hypothetical protein